MKLNYIQTCTACPEQYDVTDKNGEIVAYIRVRFGTVNVSCPDVGGESVYYELINGDGCFDDDEREYHMAKIHKKIKKWVEEQQNEF